MPVYFTQICFWLLLLAPFALLLLYIYIYMHVIFFFFFARNIFSEPLKTRSDTHHGLLSLNTEIWIF